MVCSPLTFTADVNAKVLAFRLRLKLQVNAALPISYLTTTIGSLISTMPVKVFLAEGAVANGEYDRN